jgi:methionyl-tRNA formyltransferase
METRFVFVGNRRFVLQEMLRRDSGSLSVIAIAGTHLQHDLDNNMVPVDYRVVSSKKELLALLAQTPYDVLVSNGCPYILPVTDLPTARYVNIHPSCLPDLRGVDPVVGSILHARDGGATCHVMDTHIDTGPVISQVRIPYTDDLDVTTLYQLSFLAEQRAYSLALERAFTPRFEQAAVPGDIYYSRSAADRLLSFQEPNTLLLSKIKAFNNRSQGCEFSAGGRSFRVYAATRMHNPFLVELSLQQDEGVVLFSYERSIIFRKDGEVLRFMDIVSEDGCALQVGERLL